MTLQELNQNFQLLKQLNKACDILASLEESAFPRSPVLSGLPHASGNKDKVGELAAEIADMRARVEFIENEIKRKRQEIEPFINGISDDQVRIIIRLRFLRGLSWGEVAAAIGGGNNANSVKCICYRYLRQ